MLAVVVMGSLAALGGLLAATLEQMVFTRNSYSVSDVSDVAVQLLELMEWSTVHPAVDDHDVLLTTRFSTRLS
jgi:hypothetical protein